MFPRNILEYLYQTTLHLICFIFMQKFIPGQDVDVWVKFVESKTFKLSLQMFKPEGITLKRLCSVCVCVCVCVLFV